MERSIRCGDLAVQHGLVYTWTSISSVQFPTQVQLAASDLCLVALAVDCRTKDYWPGFSEPEADSFLCHSGHNQTDFPD